jgi:hypothetical protein
MSKNGNAVLLQIMIERDSMVREQRLETGVDGGWSTELLMLHELFRHVDIWNRNPNPSQVLHMLTSGSESRARAPGSLLL